MSIGNFISRIQEYSDEGLINKYIQYTLEILSGQEKNSFLNALETEIKKRGLVVPIENKYQAMTDKELWEACGTDPYKARFISYDLQKELVRRGIPLPNGISPIDNITKSIQALRDVDLRIMYDKESKRPKLHHETNLLLKEVEIEMEKRGFMMTKEKELTNDMFTTIPSMSDEALRTQYFKESEKSLLSGEPEKHPLLMEIEKEVEKRGLTMPTANYIQRIKELDDRSLLVEFKNQLPEGGSKYKEVHKEIIRRMDKGNPANESVFDLPFEQMSNDILFAKQGLLNRQSAKIKEELIRRLQSAD